MKGRRLTGVCAVCAALLPAALPASQKAPTFPSQAELVTVDVVVLDGEGRPVSGLARDDFVVEEDGRKQTISAFEAVETTAPALHAAESVEVRPSAARVATNVAAPPTRRTFAIVFDDLHVGPINIEQAKRAVETFVTRGTVSGDRLVLVTVSDGRYWATHRGPGDARWLDSLGRVRSGRLAEGRAECGMSYYEAMQIEMMNNRAIADLVARRFAALCAPPTMRASPEQLARQAVAQDLARAGVEASSGTEGGPPSIAPVRSQEVSAAEAYARARGQLEGTLRVVREIIPRLAATPGRKSLVLVTEGFPADPSLDLFREVREEAARANVAIDFLDARGLATGPELLSSAGATGLIPGPDIGMTVALWKLEDAGSKALAEETGGLVLQTNDLVAGLERVAEESRVTYLLGYEPENAKRDGRYRRLKVSVRRPGLRVRARAGYFALKGKEDPAPEPSVVDRALRSPFDAEGIPLRLAAYVMGEGPLKSPVPKTGLEVLVAGEMRLDALETRMTSGRRVAEPKLKLLVGSRSGDVHESEWTLAVTLGEPPTAATDAWHPFLTRIAMAPGDHRARLVVHSGERVGSVTLDFIVPDLSEERLSTPILSDKLIAGAGGRRVMPVVHRGFPASSTLHAWVELHGAPRDPHSGLPRATAAFVARSVDGREWARGAPTAMSLESGTTARLVSLPLAAAPPGESELVLTIRDEVSGRSFEAREPFRVLPQPGEETRPPGGARGSDPRDVPLDPPATPTPTTG